MKDFVNLFALILGLHWAVHLSLFFLVFSAFSAFLAYVLDYNFILYAKNSPLATFYAMILPLLLPLLLLIKPISSLIQWRQRKRAVYIGRQKMEKKLNNLKPDQRGYLIPFVMDDVSSVKIDLYDGVGMSLANAKILYRASNVGDINNMSFCINSYALDYLEKNHHLLNNYVPMPLTKTQKIWGIDA